MKEEKIQDILSAALNVFFTYGYRRTSMGDIADAAGISRQGLYLYFNTKEEIFKAAIVQHGEKLLTEIEHGLSTIASAKDKIYYAFDVWTIKPFDQESSSNAMKEITGVTVSFAGADFELLRSNFESVLVSILKDTAYKVDGLTVERCAHLIYSAVRGFKLAAKDAADLGQMIKDLIQLLAL